MPPVGRATGPGNYYLFRHGLPIPVEEANFASGMVRDVPRTAIPEGGVYRMRDYLCDKPGKVYKRGGSTFASPPVGEALVNVVAVCEFPGDQRLTMISSNPGDNFWLYDVTKNTAWPGGGVSVSVLPYENPPFWVHGGTTGSLILTHGAGGKTPQRAFLSGANVAVSDITGAPQARCSCIHLNRLVLGNSISNPNRIWFSQVNDPLAFPNLTQSFIDTSGPVIGLASIQGTLIVFQRGSIQRVLGDVPPGYGSETGGNPPNMQIQAVATGTGCIDARTIVQARGSVWFASEYGIYATNGGAPVSLTTKDDSTGIGDLWRSFTFDLDAGTPGSVVAQGIYADTWLFSSVRHPAGMDFQLITHLPSEAFMTTSMNTACVSYASRAAPHAGIYGCDGNYNEPIRLLDLSSFFVPYPGPPTDADGLPVLPVLETRMVGEGPGLKAYMDAYLTYDIRNVTGPALQVEIGTNVEGTAWETVPESPMLSTTSEAARRRFSTSRDTNSLQFRLTQLSPSERTEIYMIEAAYRSYIGDGRFP